MQKHAYVVYQGQAFVQAGGEGEKGKLHEDVSPSPGQSCKSWGRVNPGAGVYEQGLDAALQGPRAPGQPTERPERGLKLAVSTDGVSLPLSKIYRASVIPPGKKEGNVNRCIKVQSTKASHWGVRPAVRNTPHDHSHVGFPSLLTGLLVGFSPAGFHKKGAFVLASQNQGPLHRPPCPQ